MTNPTGDALRRWMDADSQANVPGLQRAVSWVDYYLGMKLKPEATAVLEDLRKRLTYEIENGPSTTPVDS